MKYGIDDGSGSKAVLKNEGGRCTKEVDGVSVLVVV